MTRGAIPISTIATAAASTLSSSRSATATAVHSFSSLSSSTGGKRSTRSGLGSGPFRRLQQVTGHITGARGGVVGAGGGGGGLMRAMASGQGSAGAELSKVEIKRNGDGETVFSAYIGGEKGAPGIVVLQEWWGVDFEIKNHATGIAKKGYRTLVPDLYRGKLGLDAEEAKHLMSNLDWQGAIKDIDAAVKWLRADGSPKVGVTGFCMGGALSLASGVLVPGLDAVVAFYGTPDPGLADVASIEIPVQAHFGENDPQKGFSDKGAAKTLQEKLQTAGVPSEVFIYEGMSHAFMNASEEAIKRKKAVGFGDHNQRAVNLAWSRFDAWFDKYLKA